MKNIFSAAWRLLTGRTATERMLRDFEATFPDRCPICSFRRWGIQHGMRDVEWQPHPNCKEGNGERDNFPHQGET